MIMKSLLITGANSHWCPWIWEGLYSHPEYSSSEWATPTEKAVTTTNTEREKPAEQAGVVASPRLSRQVRTSKCSGHPVVLGPQHLSNAMLSIASSNASFASKILDYKEDYLNNKDWIDHLRIDLCYKALVYTFLKVCIRMNCWCTCRMYTNILVCSSRIYTNWQEYIIWSTHKLNFLAHNYSTI